MGHSKLDLPWPQGGTVLGSVLDVLIAAGVDDCVVVTGGHRRRVETIAAGRGVRAAYNPAYAAEDMLTSIQVGLAALGTGSAEGAFIMPADHPLVKEKTIAGLIASWRIKPDRIWAPSYKRRRGHPILVPRVFWQALVAEEGGQGLRSFLDRQAGNIEYLNVDDAGIRIDIDDPSRYQELRDKYTS
jgi:molybdenum cofactor cytidylyltransferase